MTRLRFIIFSSFVDDYGDEAAEAKVTNTQDALAATAASPLREFH